MHSVRGIQALLICVSLRTKGEQDSQTEHTANNHKPHSFNQCMGFSNGALNLCLNLREHFNKNVRSYGKSANIFFISTFNSNTIRSILAYFNLSVGMNTEGIA